ncbi:hypothetical protein [Nonomuraea sp. SBT364]|uniref:hypothetical protein n=1 Tax=Nonomuraea sp. SBT364 TaxID=1580530 RepID=UPI00066B452F|nr:hypothetical protein [Nonomuraea sp. SBT364]
MTTTSLPGAATSLDEEIVALSPPVEVFSGRAAALQVADQLHRGEQIVGRFERSGLAGFKVAARGRRLRVKVSLAVDAMSMPGWHLPDAQGRAATRPRLIQVRSQGRLRQCVLLKGGSGIRSAQATFDLLPDEVPDDGLVCVEALDITEGPGVDAEVREAVAEAVMAGGTAGLRIDGVAFEEGSEEGREDGGARGGETLDGARCEVLSLISSGGLANPNRRGPRTIRTGLFVVNPVPPGVFGSGGRLTIRLGSRADTTLRPATARDRALMRRAVRRAGGEARRLRHAAREVFCSAAPAVTRILSVQDGGLPMPTRTTAGNTLELDLPAPATSPVLVFVDPGECALPTLVSATWTP